MARGVPDRRWGLEGTTPAPTHHVEVAFDLPDVSDDLTAALAQLPEGQRAAIVLTYYADLPAPDVARILGTTSAAVRVSLMRARRRLRTLLEIDDG